MWSLVILCLIYGMGSVLGTISVISREENSTVFEFFDQPARYVSDRVPFYELNGLLVYANPANACDLVIPPPDTPEFNMNWILLAQRGGCDFQTKIENAQNSGYEAIIVHNIGNNATEGMGVQDPEKLTIYACFISEYDGLVLKNNFSDYKSYAIKIQDDFTINGYLLPFAIIVGVCFIVMLFFMLWQQVTRWVSERRRSRRRKLPSSSLKKLPVQKWTKGDPWETCAVCLEDFVENEKVRILPCSHGFHVSCIDPWLTKGRRVCPICKRKVVLPDEHFSESDTSDDDETAPLLGGPSGNPNNPSQSTITPLQQPRENPFRRAHRRLFLRNRGAPEASDASSTTGSEVSSESGTHNVSAEVYETRNPDVESVASVESSSSGETDSSYLNTQGEVNNGFTEEETSSSAVCVVENEGSQTREINNLTDRTVI